MSAVLAAWQAALAAEHQAVFGYALLGPRLSGNDQQLAVASSDAHERLRDATEAAISAHGVTPSSPLADYPALYPVKSHAAARALAIRLEDECAVAWRYLYLRAASSTGAPARPARKAAQHALTSSAVRGAQWRVIATPNAATEPFPGLQSR